MKTTEEIIKLNQEKRNVPRTVERLIELGKTHEETKSNLKKEQRKEVVERLKGYGNKAYNTLKKSIPELSKGGIKKINKLISSKTKFQKILKPNKMVVVMKQPEPNPYVNRYFKNEWEEAKKSLFFS